MSRWRWEFLRRREDYQKAFESALSNLTEPVERPIDLTEEDVALFFSYLRSWPIPDPVSKQFGLDELYDPGQSNWHQMGPWWPETGLLYGGVDDEGDGLVALTFDLSKPLAPQLKEAKRELEDCYTSHWYDEENDRVREISNNKKHPAKWLTYLRVIDGRNAGASWSTIFDHVLRPERPTNDNGAQLARGVWERAQALMKDWPA